MLNNSLAASNPKDCDFNNSLAFSNTTYCVFYSSLLRKIWLSPPKDLGSIIRQRRVKKLYNIPFREDCSKMNHPEPQGSLDNTLGFFIIKPQAMLYKREPKRWRD